MLISEIAKGLEYRDGVWYAKTQSAISYPSTGNAECWAIEDDSFWFQHRNRCLLTILKRFPPKGRLYDIGGGNGYQAMVFQASGVDVTLLEAGSAGIQYAKQRGVKELICSTLEQAQFLPNNLPSVGVFDVIEHIQDDASFIKQIANVLKSGGRMYLTVPTYQWLWSAEDVRAGHFRRYTIRRMRKLLQSAGLHVEFASYFFSPLPLPIWLTRTLPSWLGWAIAPATQQHQVTKGWISRSLAHFLGIECTLLRWGWKIPFGSSCVIVVTKL